MDHHAKILSEWKTLEPLFSLENSTHRMALMQYVLKFGDISNPARPKVIRPKDIKGPISKKKYLKLISVCMTNGL